MVDNELDPLAMLFREPNLPLSAAAKLEVVRTLMTGSPIYNEDGEVIGYSEPILTLTPEGALKLLEIKDDET